jgi:hypothetical protein
MPQHPPTPDGMLSFGDWVNYCFDRENDSWHWHLMDDHLDAEGLPTSGNWYRPDAVTVCAYLTRLFTRPGILIHRFSGDQLNWGFWFILGVSSSYLQVRLEPAVPERDRVVLVESLLSLYREFFAPLCGDSTSDDDEGHAVGMACYMMWDMDCLWPPRQPEFAAIKEAQYRVLEQALHIPSNAVRESALHGLGDTHYLADPVRVASIIDRFLGENPRIPNRLREYAMAARQGRVQ